MGWEACEKMGQDRLEERRIAKELRIDRMMKKLATTDPATRRLLEVLDEEYHK